MSKNSPYSILSAAVAVCAVVNIVILISLLEEKAIEDNYPLGDNGRGTRVDCQYTWPDTTGLQKASYRTGGKIHRRPQIRTDI